MRQIHPFREVLSYKSIGIFVRSSLPGTLWITVVNFYMGVQTEAFVIQCSLDEWLESVDSLGNLAISVSYQFSSCTELDQSAL